jgi:hypothetical protein
MSEEVRVRLTRPASLHAQRPAASALCGGGVSSAQIIRQVKIIREKLPLSSEIRDARDTHDPWVMRVV